MVKIRFLILIIIIGATDLFSQKNKFKSGNEVIAAMYKKYEGKWYRNFTFVQDIVFYTDGKETKKEVWYEALTFPGKLTIKFHSMEGKNGVVFTDNKVYPVKEGAVMPPKPLIHDLVLASFDVYFLKPETSCRLLDSLGYNLNILREDTINGRKVFVTGAEKGDDKNQQLWIDKERLYLHRIVYRQKGAVRDVILADYTLIDKNWVSKTIIFKNNGEIEAIEKYYDIKFPKSLHPDIFKPEKLAEIKW